MSASESESADEATTPVVKKVLRTVTPGYRSREDTEMNAIGWTLFLGLVILLVPFLPLIAIVWLISKALERL